MTSTKVNIVDSDSDSDYEAKEREFWSNRIEEDDNSYDIRYEFDKIFRRFLCIKDFSRWNNENDKDYHQIICYLEQEAFPIIYMNNYLKRDPANLWIPYFQYLYMNGPLQYLYSSETDIKPLEYLEKSMNLGNPFTYLKASDNTSDVDEKKKLCLKAFELGLPDGIISYIRLYFTENKDIELSITKDKNYSEEEIKIRIEERDKLTKSVISDIRKIQDVKIERIQRDISMFYTRLSKIYNNTMFYPDFIRHYIKSGDSYTENREERIKLGTLLGNYDDLKRQYEELKGKYEMMTKVKEMDFNNIMRTEISEFL